jgi:hypothetical protein
MKAKYQKGQTLAVTGAFLQIAPILYFIIIFGMAAMSLSGESDMSLFFKLGILKISMSMSGAIMSLISLVFMKYRAVWFFRFMALFSVYLVFKISFILTPIGIILALYLLSRRSEFTPPPELGTEAAVGA